MKRRGVSLIEIMVCISILAVVMLMVMALLATVNRATAKAESRAKAAALAENLLERMRHQPFSTLDTTAPTEIPVDAVAWDLPNATAQAQIAEVPGFDGHLKEVSLRIGWTERGQPAEWTQTVRISALRH